MPVKTPSTVELARAAKVFRNIAVGTIALGAATVGYAAGIEYRRWTLRTAQLRVLSPGSAPIKVLHISDLHMTSKQKSKQQWVKALAALEPDLVINTGDNFDQPDALPALLRSLEPLLQRPGAFVFGNHDYYGPVLKNPLNHLTGHKPKNSKPGRSLPWRDLRAALLEFGWLDATHKRNNLTINGQQILISGVDDPHLGKDDYKKIAGPADPGAALRLGLVHSPEPRVLDAFAHDNYDLVLAGHTHGGQLRVPGYGALVTNCGIDRSRARGVSRWGSHMWLNVSAGLGTSYLAPIRFACPPEASLLTLVARPSIPETNPLPAGETGRLNSVAAH